MPSGFDTRLSRLEKYAPVVANDDRTSPFPMIRAFVDDNGGRRESESYANATARLLGLSSADLMAYLKDRAEGVNA
ncbi:hypothetical protein [Neorhizobium petrolearium]|uniref:Uncharacterized protein n=1 Tax=Neorhizobium petrolearium TaxID=515361 RepID=A0ABY8M2S8_9HYPH|nr:hypothetical protein [Neorhizobium petrolearium]MCC2612637.1 hypothetical protein [Neorhizobium petrolearium]WGI67760.1 hypothetical protein QEO92_22685 [Neorhizobium petrolearium]